MVQLSKVCDGHTFFEGNPHDIITKDHKYTFYPQYTNMNLYRYIICTDETLNYGLVENDTLYLIGVRQLVNSPVCTHLPSLASHQLRINKEDSCLLTDS